MCNDLDTSLPHKSVSITQDDRPLPPLLADPAADALQFDTTDPWVEPPLRADYGTQLVFAPGAFINSGATFIDTCAIRIGPRVLLGPNVSFYAGRHPVDPAVRRGLQGPEDGAEIEVEADVWVGGGAIVLAGVTLGRGCVVGAGSVVTKVSALVLTRIGS